MCSSQTVIHALVLREADDQNKCTEQFGELVYLCMPTSNCTYPQRCAGPFMHTFVSFSGEVVMPNVALECTRPRGWWRALRREIKPLNTHLAKILNSNWAEKELVACLCISSSNSAGGRSIYMRPTAEA